MGIIKSVRFKRWVGLGAGIVLGLIFLLSGVGKLLNEYDVFFIFFTPFADFLLPFAPLIYLWLPVVEIAVGLLLITGILARPAAALALGLIAIFIANNSWLIAHGFGDQPCGCFGILEEIARLRILTIGALVLDVVMLLLALAILFLVRVSFFNINSWFWAEKRPVNNEEAG
ncbi:MAG TPA: MauE/DoxX family redox-associated membrane protein [Dehalococcoidales bacterium]|nr:MauE/DoxX family redox-associated membrane protein [Dehalococcoidales bacterium]